MKVRVVGGCCLDCGVTLRGINWNGDPNDRQPYPVELEADEVRVSSAEGCGECGGQVQFEVEPVGGAA